MIAYVLLTTSPMFEHEVYLALYRAEEIDDIYPLFGEYDLICKLEAVDREAIQKIIEQNIKTIPGVTCTKTLMGY